MKSIVLGAGRWGSFIAYYLDKIGNDVTLYGRSSEKFNEMIISKKNDYIELPDNVSMTTNISDIRGKEYVFIAISAQNLRRFLMQIRPYLSPNQAIVLCIKGIEIETGMTMSQVAVECLGEKTKIAVWLGPGHPQDFVKQIPNCMVIDSNDEILKNELVALLSSELIRFYYGTDLIGNEVGAATKNVIGIAAGMLDGLKMSALKGPLMSRATKEISELICAMGGNAISAYGLCHLGDYEATVFSENSNNRKFGEIFVMGKSFSKLAEGYYTLEAVINLKKRYKLELPICSAVYEILYCNGNPQVQLYELFCREIKKEF